jgi:hypothetical protein
MCYALRISVGKYKFDNGKPSVTINKLLPERFKTLEEAENEKKKIKSFYDSVKIICLDM